MSGRANRPREEKNDLSGRVLKAAIVALLVVLVAGGGAFVFWATRGVEVTVNGRSLSIPEGLPMESLVAVSGVSVRRGDFVSVGGNVLQEGGGDRFGLTLDGTLLSYEDARDAKVEAGRDYEFSDGADVTEDFDEKVVDVAPKLRLDGKAGAVAYVEQWGRAGKKRQHVGRTSGEAVDVEVLEDPQDMVVRLTNVHPDGGRRLVALTFDDGPNASYTQAYLDILREHGAVATFFQLGSQVASSPSLAKAVADAGCEVASHTTSHQQLTKLSADDVFSEVSGAFDKIREATGVSTSVLRPPYGAWSLDVWLGTRGTTSAMVLWNQDSQDWRKPGVDAIVQNATATVGPGNIILMHDGGGNRDQDLEALPQIIDSLHEQGYTFVTVSQLLASDSSIPAEVASGTVTMPSDAAWPDAIA